MDAANPGEKISSNGYNTGHLEEFLVKDVTTFLKDKLKFLGNP